LVGTAGTTSTGTVDPLAELAGVAHAEDLWFHVDGAYGGLFALCEEGQKILGGIQDSDTVVVDPHKTLFIPYGTGAVLARTSATLTETYSATADYLAPSGDGVLSPSDLDLELTRPFRGLRVWLPLQLAGTQAFAEALSEKVQLARYAYTRLEALAGFELGPSPDLAIVTCRFLPRRGDADAANLELIRGIQEAGRVYVTGTRVRGRAVIRLAIGSFRTHREHVDEAITTLQEAAAHLPEM
jgi:aromatic-L-amino-acid decarboxylase